MGVGGRGGIKESPCTAHQAGSRHTELSEGSMHGNGRLQGGKTGLWDEGKDGRQ